MSLVEPVEIRIVEAPSAELVEALELLLPQLSSSAPSITLEALAEIIACPTSTLLIARWNGQIVGALTLVVFRIPTAQRAWIEDVVVDRTARGRGAGEALVRAAVEMAQRRGAKTVDLTSRRSREAAHRLYEKVGFHLRETSVYRYGAKPIT